MATYFFYQVLLDVEKFILMSGCKEAKELRASLQFVAWEVTVNIQSRRSITFNYTAGMTYVTLSEQYIPT